MAKTAEFVATTVSGQDRFQLLAAALQLCPDCQKMLRQFCEAHNATPEEMVRRILWKWFGQWNHGRTCGNKVSQQF